MIKLEAGNVLLKPSHRRQLMAWLKRAVRLGDRMGDFMLTLSLHRQGRLYDVRATVHDRAGDFNCHSRDRSWRDALRNVTASLTTQLHTQSLQRI